MSAFPKFDPVDEIGESNESIENFLILERTWNYDYWLWLVADNYVGFIDSDYGWPWP